jgi:hypothetical protein
MKQISVILFVFSVFFFAEKATAFYKYIDENGAVVFSDNCPPDANCEAVYGGSNPPATFHNDSRRGHKGANSAEDEFILNTLYNRAIGEAESGTRSVGGAACYNCLAEVINIVTSRGQPINPRFITEVKKTFDGERRSVGGLLNIIQRAASYQSINISGIAPCDLAMMHSRSHWLRY